MEEISTELKESRSTETLIWAERKGREEAGQVSLPLRSTNAAQSESKGGAVF
jgi:hypothetical protein